MLLLSRRHKSHHIVPPCLLLLPWGLQHSRQGCFSSLDHQGKGNMKSIYHSHFHKWEITICCGKSLRYCYCSITYANVLIQWFIINSRNAERWRKLTSNRKKANGISEKSTKGIYKNIQKGNQIGKIKDKVDGLSNWSPCDGQVMEEVAWYWERTARPRITCPNRRWVIWRE